MRVRFKAHGPEADWLAKGRQENDWARVMTTPWEKQGGSKKETRSPRNPHHTQQCNADEGIQSILTEFIYKLHS